MFSFDSQAACKRKQEIPILHGGKRLLGEKIQLSIFWLSDANVANFCHNISTLELPLKAYEEENDFKVYLSDTGLLVSQYKEGTALDIITDKIGRHKGAIYENAVAQMLTAKGYRLHFFKPSQNMEIDFVIRFEDSVCPIEVKSSEHIRSRSLTSLLSNEKYKAKKAIRLSTKNIGEENGILSLPVYMAFLLWRDAHFPRQCLSNFSARRNSIQGGRNPERIFSNRKLTY